MMHEIKCPQCGQVALRYDLVDAPRGTFSLLCPKGHAVSGGFGSTVMGTSGSGGSPEIMDGGSGESMPVIKWSDVRIEEERRD